MTETSDENVLKVNVAEDIKMDDVPPGTPAPKQVDAVKDVKDDAKETIQAEINKFYEKSIKLLERYVEPHKNVSRWVTDADVERVVKDAQDMLDLCTIPRGVYGNAEAIAHSQIDGKDPLRFFVTKTGLVVINPVIVSHSEHTIVRSEGCMTYPSDPIKHDVKRYNRIVVRYQVLVSEGEGDDKKPKISDPHEVPYKGAASCMFQHEIAHLNGHYIYDKDSNARDCEGFEEGVDPKTYHVDGLVTHNEDV